MADITTNNRTSRTSGSTTSSSPTSSSTRSSTTSATAGSDESLYSTTTPTGDTVVRSSTSGSATRTRTQLEEEYTSTSRRRATAAAELETLTRTASGLRTRTSTIQDQIVAEEKKIEQYVKQQNQNESEIKKLKEEYDKNNVKLLKLIRGMNDKMSETNEQIAKAVQEQDSNFRKYQDEAKKLVEDGKLTEEEIPGYIAQRLGNNDIAKSIAKSGMSLTDSDNAQILSIVSAMSGTLEKMNSKSLEIAILTARINESLEIQDALGIELDGVNSELEVVNGNIATTQNTISGFDQTLAEIAKQIQELMKAEKENAGEEKPADTPQSGSADPTAPTASDAPKCSKQAKGSGSGNTNPAPSGAPGPNGCGAGQGCGSGKGASNKDQSWKEYRDENYPNWDSMSKSEQKAARDEWVNNKANQEYNEAHKSSNNFSIVSGTINYSEFASVLKNIMSQSSVSISQFKSDMDNTLRTMDANKTSLNNPFASSTSRSAKENAEAEQAKKEEETKQDGTKKSDNIFVNKDQEEKEKQRNTTAA